MYPSSAGLGYEHAEFVIHIANRPPLDEYNALDKIRPMEKGEIAYIASSTGNHWRKIFNVYAKLFYALKYENRCTNNSDTNPYSSWQNFRDENLLQAHSNTALVFSNPKIQFSNNLNPSSKTIHYIAGKTYAAEFEHINLISHNSDFSICKSKQCTAGPYLDYRQLSNLRIEKLVSLIQSLSTTQSSYQNTK
jgi:hypothetical protein